MRASLSAFAVFFGISTAVCGRGPDAPAAIVNGEPITVGEIDAFLAARPLVARTQSAEQQNQLRRDVLTILIDDMVLKQFLKAKGPPVEGAQVDQHMKNLEARLASQRKTMADYLKETRQTCEQVKTNFGLMLQWTSYANKLISDADQRKYFEENRAYFDRAMVRASHIVIRMPSGASEAERAAAQARLRTLRQEIAAGRLSFAEAAAKNSQCPTAAQGGDLGYIARKWMVDESVAQAAFALQINGISDVVSSEMGYHLIQATDKRPGDTAFFEDPRIQAAVRDCLVEEMRLRTIADLRKSARIEIKLP